MGASTEVPEGPNARLCSAEALILHALAAVRRGDVIEALENVLWAAVPLTGIVRAERDGAP